MAIAIIQREVAVYAEGLGEFKALAARRRRAHTNDDGAGGHDLQRIILHLTDTAVACRRWVCVRQRCSYCSGVWFLSKKS